MPPPGRKVTLCMKLLITFWATDQYDRKKINLSFYIHITLNKKMKHSGWGDAFRFQEKDWYGLSGKAWMNQPLLHGLKQAEGW